MREVSAPMTIREGKLEGFKQQGRRNQLADEREDTQTLRYEWFLNSDQTACEVREGLRGVRRV